MDYNLLKKLGSGSAGDGYLLPDSKVMIVGKREDSFATYKSMCEKLKKIDGKITTIKYPQIYELISPCAKYPFGAIVEEGIFGKELKQKISGLNTDEKIEIGKHLGLFLKELHSIPTDYDKGEEIAINLNKYDKSIGILKDYLPENIINLLANVKNDYHKLITSRDFCITHGDLNAGNIMINADNTLSGIIDFGNMEYYIPDVEFVHMYFFDKEIFSSMRLHYGKHIDERDMTLLELVINIRHFKNIVKFEDKRKHCLDNIKDLLNKYTSKKH